MEGFAIVGRSRVLTGPVITVDDVVLVDPDGGRHDRQVVNHPGAVSVVAVTDTDCVVMVRQYRVAVGCELLEIPAGKRDVAGEDPAVTASRELAEEVGLQASRLEPLVEFHNSPGFTNEHSIVFLATGLSPCASDRHGVEEQHLTVVEVPLAEVGAMVASGEIRDAKSIIGLVVARERLAT